MLFVESSFVYRIQPFVQNFKKKNDYLWNFSCPICGDVSKGRKKVRGFIYLRGNQLNYRCHHCAHSVSFKNFLRDQFPLLYKEFVLENFKTENHVVQEVPQSIAERCTPIEEKTPDIVYDNILRPLKWCKTLKSTHPVYKYLKSRSIPTEFFEHFYYATKFKKYTNSIIPNKFSEKSLETDHPRLLIPFFTVHGKVFAFVARAFGKEEPKYFTIKLDESYDRVFGLDRVNYRKRIYAVEGPIDSLFIPNFIAVSGSSFDCETTRRIKTNLTLVPDNEPRSKDICRIIKSHLKLGYDVCMFPHDIKEKDINDMILAGRTPTDIKRIIDNNTFNGPTGLLKLADWRLC